MLCCSIFSHINIYSGPDTWTMYTNEHPSLTDWDLRMCCLWNVCISQWETGGGAAVAMTTAISLPYGGGGGKQASNKCLWAVDGDVCSVGRWTQFTTGNIHIYKPEKLFNWQKKKLFCWSASIFWELSVFWICSALLSEKWSWIQGKTQVMLKIK